jgi:hypothetical protein
MSFEAAVASAGGDEAVLLKSFVIALDQIVASWFSKLAPLSISSYETLRAKFLENFHGFQVPTDGLEELSECRQKDRETLAEYYQRFLRVKAENPDIPEDIVIPLYSKLTRKRPASMQELYDRFEQHSKSETSHRRKMDDQRRANQEVRPP